ncbi:MAG: sulfite exporter TauE/SafE family protein [Acidobacteria bacterium]|nr:sulfite exporter TauE/SafE family protein [Acidobacteriota bacterium]
MLEIFIGLLIIFTASLVQGLTAFGMSLISVPLLVIFMSPKIIVPIMILHGLLLNAYLLYSCRKDVNLKRIIPLMICGIIGIPFGAYLLKILSQESLKIFIGVVISFFAILFLLGFSVKIKREKAAFVPIGLASGLLNGSISMSGPPVILFFTNQGTAKAEFRANLVSYFLTMNIFTIPVFIFNGLFSSESVLYALYFLPGLILGMVLGNALAHKVPEKLFRKIALCIVLLTGVMSLLSGLGIM